MTTLSAFTATRAGLHAPGYDRGEDWRESAACRETDPELFFPTIRAGARAAGDDPYAEARAICAGCPIREACLDDAMTAETRSGRHGMYGGATPEERQSIYRARGRAGRVA